ncbi:hypothetical protein AB0D08_21160 [Kitasatospora sp. NPDC048540]|uniref:hypothetical protein n=1 Tax=Kitasatospora sp. NPDC048540 TaxID=3155634 RepID=UPI0033E50877
MEPPTRVDWTAIDSDVHPATYEGQPVYCHGYPVLADPDGYLYVVDENREIRYVCTAVDQYVPQNPQVDSTVHLGNWGGCWVITDEYGAQAVLEAPSIGEIPPPPSTGGATQGSVDDPTAGAYDTKAAKGEIAARLRELGAAAGGGDETALIKDVKSVIESIEGIFYPSFVLSGVVFLSHVSQEVQYWLSVGFSTGDLADLLSDALAAHGTTMRVDQLPQKDVQAYLGLGYTLLRDTWSSLRTPEDRIAFVRENMNTDKYNYGRAIEALGRAPRRNMGTVDIMMEHMFTNANTKTFGTFQYGRPNTHFTQIEDELASGKDSAALRVAIEKSFVQVLGVIWNGHFAKHKSNRGELRLDAFTELVWGDMEAIVGFFPEAAQMLVRSICPDRESLRVILDEQLMLWAEDGNYFQ